MWFPEFEEVRKMAGGEAEIVQDLVVHDPAAGKVAGAGAFSSYSESNDRWRDEMGARIETLASTITPGRAVGEYVAHLKVDGKEIGLPIAVVCEVNDARAEFRIYHSQWPLLGRHVMRPPILDDTGVDPEGWPGRYHAALTAGDADAIAATFEPGGYFREPAGADFVHGGEELHPFFAMFFSLGGGIHLEHCAITDDGTRCCLEFNAVRWGDVDIPRQAGIGIYERGPSGKLQAARVYDDVDPPEFD